MRSYSSQPFLCALVAWDSDSGWLQTWFRECSVDTMGNVYNHMATMRGTAAQRDTTLGCYHTHTHTVWIRSAAIWLPPSPNHHGTHTQEQGIIWNVFCAQYSSFVFRDMWFTGWAYIGTHVQSCLHQTDKYKQYTHFVSGNYTALYKWFTHKGQLDRSCTIKFWFRLLCLDWLKSDQSEH